ncbi:unnamed protein product [Adineta ricciae]|uniref:Uncharacterized protein n=1 Tax=Adineta ricciae TaxID=249248 RepID=A0A816CQS3_ADIRI|nr:unnamed protein product [Adineta ricciae]
MLSSFQMNVLFLIVTVIEGDALISLWQQNCKVHADSSHAELKKVIQEQEKFNSNNWSHCELVAMLVSMGLVLVVGVIYIYCQLMPILRIARTIRRANQPIAQNGIPHNNSNSNPPYTAQHVSSH